MFPIPPSTHPWLHGIWTERVEEHVSLHMVQCSYGPAVPQADEENVPVLDCVFVDLPEPPVSLLPGGELILSIAVRVTRFGHGQDGAQLSFFN